jgi:hypothetical protein
MKAATDTFSFHPTLGGGAIVLYDRRRMRKGGLCHVDFAHPVMVTLHNRPHKSRARKLLLVLVASREQFDIIILWGWESY